MANQLQGIEKLRTVRSNSRFLQVAVSFLALLSTASAQVITSPPVTRFVGPNGNDSNPGTITQPYLTIQRCVTAVSGGSTCMVRAGTYHETVTPNSGVTITSYNGESVTVDGTDPVSGWTPYQGSIYQASVALANDDSNQVFVGNQMMTEARWPNGFDLFHVNWATAQAGTNDSLLVDSNLPNIDWTGAKVHFLSGSNPWAAETATVTGSAGGQLTITLDDETYPPEIQPQAGGLYYLYRLPGALDAGGEWFYDPAAMVLYFWAPGNLNPNTLGVRAKRRQYAFDLSGRSNVTIQNIDIFASTINMSSSSANNTLNGINAQYLSQYTDLPSQFKLQPGASAYDWQDHIMDTGIILNGSNNVLMNSTIAWSAGNAVALLGSNNKVTNNLIMETGYVGNNASGINLFGTGHSVQNNTIHTSGRSALTINSYPVSPNNDDFSFNNMFNAMLLSFDAGEIYTGDTAVTGTRIHNNWLHDTQTPTSLPVVSPRAGVYIDTDGSGFEVDQNVIWNSEYNNILLHGYSADVSGPFNDYVHNNSIPDVAANGYIWLLQVLNCGTTQVVDNLVFVPISQNGTSPECMASDNGPTAPGATEMTSTVQVGCNFAGCSSSGPPAISGTSVAASIALQPFSMAVPAGQTATFTVIAEGSPTLSYQWQRNGTNIPGATSASYSTPATTVADNGAVFTVAVSNSIGGAMSNPATLTIGTTPVLAPVIAAVVNAEGGSATMAPNTWVVIAGSGLSALGDSRLWQGSDFVNNQMPAQLDGVSVTMNGENAFVYYISPNQVNVLTPPDLTPGPVQVTVTTGGMASAAFTAQAQQYSPSFFIFGAGPYVVGTHTNGSLLGPASLYPGLSTPAVPGEVVVLYANGFGPVSPPVVAGSNAQSGSLSALPVVQIGGVQASVQFAGLVSPGLFQFNVVVPSTAANGDNKITAQYNGLTTQAGVLLTIQSNNSPN